MEHLAFGIENDEDRITETAAVVETLHEFGRGLLARVVVDVYVLEVVGNDLGDVGILADEIGKTKAPDAPVATHLTDGVLTRLTCFGNGTFNLCQGVDGLVVDLLERFLSETGLKGYDE